MINENVFEMPQFDGSSYRLLWQAPRAVTVMGATTIEFDRGDYPLLLVVSKRVYNYPNMSQNEIDNLTALNVLVNTANDESQVIGGTPYVIPFNTVNAEGYKICEGFFRTATVVDKGLSISEAQWKYGTYTGSTHINYFVIPTMIYGIR